MFRVIFVLFLSLAAVLGVTLQQNTPFKTRQIGKTVYIDCIVKDLSSAYVHWYQKKDNEALKRILYTSNTNDLPVRDSNHPDKNDFGVSRDGVKYSLKIDKLKKSHSAVYYCASWESGARKVFGSGTRLQVTENTLSAKISAYTTFNHHVALKHTLLCQVRDINSNLVRFTWEAKGPNGAAVEDGEQLEQSDETQKNQITSMLIIDKQNAKTHNYKCKVQYGESFKDLSISKDTETQPKTCGPKDQAKLPSNSMAKQPHFSVSTELGRSLNLFSMTYLMLMVKNVLYFCTLALILYRRKSAVQKMVRIR